MGTRASTLYSRCMDENRVTTLESHETVPAEFYDQMRDRAIRWSESNLARLERMGCTRQVAANQILAEVTRHWGPECAHEVERRLGIQFRTHAASRPH
jgi:hypothetical protein